nr:MAG TPA: hypothetical protein [Bacteriophage sp.]
MDIPHKVPPSYLLPPKFVLSSIKELADITTPFLDASHGVLLCVPLL